MANTAFPKFQQMHIQTFIPMFLLHLPYKQARFLQQHIWLSFMSKPKVIMLRDTSAYFQKPTTVTYDHTLNKVIDFYWFPSNNPSKNRMGINLPQYSTYKPGQ